MNAFKYIGRFIFLVLTQVLVLNQLEVGLGIQGMIYPMFIIFLPVEIGVILLMTIAFVMGMSIDAMSNTYGLHTSALLAVAFARPFFFDLFAPRDGYDPLVEPDMFSMGRSWFFKTYGVLLLLHHLWFFSLEMFKFSEILLILQKTFLSIVFSFVLSILVHYLLVKRPKKNEI
jgi:hypothetical protein